MSRLTPTERAQQNYEQGREHGREFERVGDRLTVARLYALQDYRERLEIELHDTQLAQNPSDEERLRRRSLAAEREQTAIARRISRKRSPDYLRGLSTARPAGLAKASPDRRAGWFSMFGGRTTLRQNRRAL